MKSLGEAAAQTEVLWRLANILPGDRARWGSMSAHQMLCHLNDAYLFALGDCAVSEMPIWLPRRVLKWLALRVPMHWPKGFPAAPEIAQEGGGTRPVDFESDRRLLLTNVERFCGGLPQPLPRHPHFGSMSRNDWMRWGYLHADHHLRQFGR